MIIGNPEAENVFSLQNHIKALPRDQFRTERVDKLMEIKYHGKITDGYVQAAA